MVVDEALNKFSDEQVEVLYSKVFGESIENKIKQQFPGRTTAEYDELIGTWRTFALLNVLKDAQQDYDLSEVPEHVSNVATLIESFFAQPFNFQAFTSLYELLLKDADDISGAVGPLTWGAVGVALFFALTQLPVEVVNVKDSFEDVMPHVGKRTYYGGGTIAKVTHLLPWVFSFGEGLFEVIPQLMLCITVTEAHLGGSMGWAALFSFYLYAESMGIIGNLKNSLAEKIPNTLRWGWNSIRSWCGWDYTPTYKRQMLRHTVSQFDQLLDHANEATLADFENMQKKVQ